MLRFRFPHPLTLMVGCIAVAAVLTRVLPAGRFDRRQDPVTGREVVVAGTYHRVEATPVGAFDAVVSIPRGLADAGSIVFLVFLVGGAFTVVDKTGALAGGVDWLAHRFEGREAVLISVTCLVFAAGGALDNMKEEIIALVPVLLLLTRRIGYRPIVAVAMSMGAAAVGAAFSPINPFQVGIAQKLAGLPLLSGGGFRLASLAVALVAWTWTTMRYAERTRTVPVVGETGEGLGAARRLSPRDGPVLGLVLAAFAIYVYGVMKLGWDFDQMSALFFVMGVTAGLVGGLGVTGTANGFVEGFRSMAYAALLIGFARAIYIVLAQGQVIDTIVYGLFKPIAGFPLAVSAFGMMAVHTLIHVPVPSVSGQAVLTMPVLVPLSDLLGLSRQVAILAYQFGAGLCDLFTPTDGALMAIIAAAGVSYEEWLTFVVPRYALLAGIGAVVIGIAIAIGFS